MSTIVVNVNGTLGTVIQCPTCQHTNPPQCPGCKPLGTETCIGCVYRGGGVPALDPPMQAPAAGSGPINPPEMP